MTSTPRAHALRGSALLLCAALFWGLGFYAQRVSIETTPPLWATALRFVVAAPLALAVLLHRRRAAVRIPWRAGTVLGVLLYLAFALQTVAMRHTSVSRVALITGLYAVLTPLLQPFFGLRPPTKVQILAASLASIGAVLLCGVVGDAAALSTPPNVGDAYTLVMAIVSAVLVLLIGRLAPREDALALNTVQILAMFACSVVVAPLWEGPLPTAPDTRTWISLLYLATASTFVAFLLQVLGQRDVSPATASVLMLVETPIGVLSAVLLLGERMSVSQWMGAVVALVSVVVAVVGERRSFPSPGPPPAQ